MALNETKPVSKIAATINLVFGVILIALSFVKSGTEWYKVAADFLMFIMGCWLLIQAQNEFRSAAMLDRVTRFMEK